MKHTEHLGIKRLDAKLWPQGQLIILSFDLCLYFSGNLLICYFRGLLLINVWYVIPNLYIDWYGILSMKTNTTQEENTHLCPICKLGRDNGVSCFDIMSHGSKWNV